MVPLRRTAAACFSSGPRCHASDVRTPPQLVRRMPRLVSARFMQYGHTGCRGWSRAWSLSRPCRQREHLAVEFRSLMTRLHRCFCGKSSLSSTALTVHSPDLRGVLLSIGVCVLERETCCCPSGTQLQQLTASFWVVFTTPAISTASSSAIASSSHAEVTVLPAS